MKEGHKAGQRDRQMKSKRQNEDTANRQRNEKQETD